MSLRCAVVALGMIGGTLAVALADSNSPEFSAVRLPPIQFPAHGADCGSTILSDSLGPFVSGGVREIVGDNAVVYIGLSARPTTNVKAVIGFFVIDGANPTYVVMTPGTSEKFILLHPSLGLHEAVFGTIDMLSNGDLKQVDSFRTCFEISNRR